jgi:hypothetical protein
MASLTNASAWYNEVQQIPLSLATRLGPQALSNIQSKYTKLLQGSTTTEILSQRIQWASDTPYLRLNSDPIPDGILPAKWRGILHEIKVNPKGYGKKMKKWSPPTDDAVYENEEMVRRLVPRGCCFLELFMGVEGDGGEEKRNKSTAKNKTENHLIMPGVFAMRKFSGGLGDEDNDKNEIKDRTKANDTTKETSDHAGDRWENFFTRPFEDATVVVAAKKANGEAAHASCVRLPNGSLLTICGSKHVHMAFIDPSQIDLYKESKYTIASIVAKTFVSSPAGLNNRCLNFMADTGLTACFEIEQPSSMHVEMFHFKEPRLQFLAFTSADIGTASGEKQNIAVTRTTTSKTTTTTTTTTTKTKTISSPEAVAVEGQCLPPVYGYKIASTFGLTPVAYKTHPVSDLDEIISSVRRRHGDEGDVLYFVANDGETIGLVKTKTVWYVVARALREKMRTMISKATKIKDGKSVKGFWNEKQGIVDKRVVGETNNETFDEITGNKLSKKEVKRRNKKKSKQNKGTQYIPPTKEDVLNKLCESTVASVNRRIDQLQIWLKFNDRTKSKFNSIGTSFIKWSMKKFQMNELLLNDVACTYPVLWLNHLKECNLSDQFPVKMMGEEDDGGNGEQKEMQDEDENEGDTLTLSSILTTNDSDFNVIKIDNLKVCITTKMAQTSFSPLFDDSWTGSQVWECSIMLSQYILRENVLNQNSNVIELGAGVGLVSLVCALAGSKVVSTDQKMFMATIEANRVKNNIDPQLMQIKPLNWQDVTKDTPSTFFSGGRYDFVFVSDCLNPVYGDDNISDLGKALTHLVFKDVTCYLAFEDRDEKVVPNLYELMLEEMGGKKQFESKIVFTSGNRCIYRLKRK